MKPTLSLLLCLITGAAFAQPHRIVVQGGDTDRTNVIVNVEAPKGSIDGKVGMLVAADGSTLPVQEDESGHLCFIIPSVPKEKKLTYVFGQADGIIGITAVDVTQGKGTLKLAAAGHPICVYQMEAGDVPKGVSEVFKHGAHLHPIYSPGGHIVTGNHPPDHRWHRGVWLAWTDTDFEGRHPDFWNEGKGDGKDKSGDKLLAEVRFGSLVTSWSGPVHGGFVSKHRFIDNTGEKPKDVLNETWQVTTYAITATPKPLYVIDLVSTQTCAGDSPLKLPKYFYGGLGVRGNAEWDPEDRVSMLTSNGDDRKKGDSTKGRWVHMGGSVDGQPTGIGVLIHPGNFRFPQPLRLNPKNPQLCVAPSQDGDWSIEPGKPYVSRYRLIIADGVPDAAAMEREWKNYGEPLKVTLE